MNLKRPRKSLQKPQIFNLSETWQANEGQFSQHEVDDASNTHSLATRVTVKAYLPSTLAVHIVEEVVKQAFPVTEHAITVAGPLQLQQQTLGQAGQNKRGSFAHSYSAWMRASKADFAVFYGAFHH